MNTLPPYATRELIWERLPLIFPEGTPQRGYLTREIAASIIFTMLYIGAIADQDIYLGPVHVYRMTEEQASLTSADDRIAYANAALKKNFKPAGNRWYEDNTREPIRDETLKEGLVHLGAVGTRNGIATTSSKPRYYLKKDFAALFNPELEGEILQKAVTDWQQANLSKSALTRLSLASLSSKKHSGELLVTFPNGETRHISAGPSSEISKAVIEVFAPKFLREPAVLWLSTSDKKVITRDDAIANSIGLHIQPDLHLPDIILADLGPADPLLVFIEVVATDGPINERRQQALYKITDAARFDRKNVAFITAYFDRESQGYTKTVKSLAWNSFAWFVSEPEKLIHLKEDPGYLDESM